MTSETADNVSVPFERSSSGLYQLQFWFSHKWDKSNFHSHNVEGETYNIVMKELVRYPEDYRVVPYE